MILRMMGMAVKFSGTFPPFVKQPVKFSAGFFFFVKIFRQFKGNLLPCFTKGENCGLMPNSHYTNSPLI